jgi:hypothetical protein
MLFVRNKKKNKLSQSFLEHDSLLRCSSKRDQPSVLRAQKRCVGVLLLLFLHYTLNPSARKQACESKTKCYGFNKQLPQPKVWMRHLVRFNEVLAFLLSVPHDALVSRLDTTLKHINHGPETQHRRPNSHEAAPSWCRGRSSRSSCRSCQAQAACHAHASTAWRTLLHRFAQWHGNESRKRASPAGAQSRALTHPPLRMRWRLLAHSGSGPWSLRALRWTNVLEDFACVRANGCCWLIGASHRKDTCRLSRQPVRGRSWKVWESA